jgi:hypothetical protein
MSQCRRQDSNLWPSDYDCWVGGFRCVRLPDFAGGTGVLQRVARDELENFLKTLPARLLGYGSLRRWEQLRVRQDLAGRDARTSAGS